MMEDPIFEPWSVEDVPHAAPEWPQPSDGTVIERPAVAGHDTAGFLRAVAVPLMEALCTRLRLARHDASLSDLLADPEHLIRFTLTPWVGPLSDTGADGPSRLEIGLGGAEDSLVTAWYWLDPASQAPNRVATVQSPKLTASWVERVILDFVGEVLARS